MSLRKERIGEKASTEVTAAFQKWTTETELSTSHVERLDDSCEFLSFVSEDAPEDFFNQSASDRVSGTFTAIVNPPSTIVTDGDADWEVDLSRVAISGDGIRLEKSIVNDENGEHDFLKVRNRGRQSAKRAAVQSGTRLSIDVDICMTWAERVAERGWFTPDDMETLVALCDGNGDPEELRINLQRNLEAAGLELVEQGAEDGFVLWDARADTTPYELAEAIESVFSRKTRLPGTWRFIMDKSSETQLLAPMVRAKQELQLNILSCEAAVDIVLENVDCLRDGSADARAVALSSIIATRPDHAETAEFFAAADVLKIWRSNGRAMDGKRRRAALKALDALDLSLSFYKEIVRSLTAFDDTLEYAIRMDQLIASFEAAIEQLLIEHLPYARGFAARQVGDGGAPEDVSQGAFRGLRRPPRRFDPERNIRFVIYSAFWMKQALMRWRADEGSAIRVPVHRQENLGKLEQAAASLDFRADGTVTDDALAVELGWSSEDVRRIRRIPRQAQYPESFDEWDGLLPQPQIEDFFDQAETERIVTEALAELPARQADVIRMRFGIGRAMEMTLEEIGRIHGVTRERIRQIEVKALKQLSHPASKRRLQALLRN
mgnify:CR=1 FL=1